MKQGAFSRVRAQDWSGSMHPITSRLRFLPAFAFLFLAPALAAQISFEGGAGPTSME